MSIYHPSSYFKKLIKEKFNREPFAVGGDYLDLEWQRSMAYENGDMRFVTRTSKSKTYSGRKATWDEMVDLNVRMGRLLRGEK